MIPDTPQIPRSEWERHPNFPSQVLLLGSHQSFRRVSHTLVESTTTDDSLAWSENLYRRWISAMRSHERYEEHKLYPFLEARWDVSMSEATDGHEALHRADKRVRQAYQAGDVETVTAALQNHDRVLDAHLATEEDLVIPLLLALTPDEFRDYYTLPIGVLLDRLRTAH